MRIRAADSEGRDARATRCPRLRPRHRLRQELDSTRRPVDVRGRLVHVEGLRQDALPHRHDHLDDAAHAGRRRGVADVGLDRPQPQRAAVGPFLTVGRDERLGLYRVAETGARAVRLHRVHLRGGQAGVRQGLADHALLGRAVRGRQAVGRAVLVDRAAPDHREDLVAEAPCVGEAFHQEHAHALGPARAVRCLREGLAAAVRREAALARELHERGRGREERDAARERHAALALSQGLRGKVQGDQGRRARGVDRHRGALKAHHVRDAAGDHAGRGARDEVAFAALGGLGGAGAVAGRGGSGEDADLLAAHRRRVDARALEDLPGGFEEEPLLRVHRQGLARGDPEEACVEVARPVQEAALEGVARTGVGRVGVVDAFQVPAAGRGEAGDAVAACGKEPPQVLGALDLAGVAAAHPDDGDQVVVLGGRGVAGRSAGARGGRLAGVGRAVPVA
ncbi:hypothetical protein EES42_42690 [Streptomyces sp. ADI95-17]|nr:hypothetical protein EES42_42690 [Streptomyces sp. ADI95-17]